MKSFTFITAGCILALMYAALAENTFAKELPYIEPASEVIITTPADSSETDSLAIARQWVVDSMNLRRMEQREEADSLLVLAREFASRTDDFMVRFMAYTESGNFYEYYREPEESNYYYRKVLDFLDEDDFARRASTNNNIAHNYANFYDYSNAIYYQNKSLGYRYRVDENHPSRNFGLAASFASIGRTYYSMHQYEESLRAYDSALRYIGEIDHPLLQFNLRSAIGELNVAVGNYAGALSFFQEANTYAIEMQLPSQIAISYLSLGLAYDLIEMNDEALKYYLKAKELHDTISTHTTKNRTYDRLTNLFIKTRDLDEAQIYLDKWSAFEAESPDQVVKGRIAIRKGYIQYLRGNYQQAEDYYHHVVAFAAGLERNHNEPDYLWKRALNMAMLDRERGFEMAEKAMAATEELRRYRTITGENRAEVFRGFNPYYAKLSALYLNDGMIDDAFRVAESAGSRAFAEDIMNISDINQRLADQGKREEFDEIRNEIVRLENTLISVRDEEESIQINRSIRDLRLQSEAMVSALYSNHSDFGAFSTPQIVSLADARKSLSENEAGLRMMVNEDGISAILFTQDEVITWGVEITQHDLMEKVNLLRDSITENVPLEEVNRELDEMGRFLFTDIAREKLLTVERLILSPDGILSYIPFESLRLWDERYMVEQLIVSQTPSFTVRNILKERQKERENRPSARALAMANPVFAEPASAPPVNESVLVLRSENLRPLPFSGLEGDWVKNYFPGEVNLLSGENASESYFSGSDLNQYSLIHFATHGIMEDTNPRLSRIVLSAPGPDETEIDGLLSVSEIYQLDLSSDLVVLSACNTGLGRLIDGEGILGFQRAFLQAGSASVAVTLWSVEDRSTAMLMRSFYQNLNRLNNEGEGMDYAKALRQARLEMISRPGFNHPYQWASFILTGI